MLMRHRLVVILVLVFAMATCAAARDAPSRPGVDAPELAHLGRFDVGVRTIDLVDAAQVDLRSTPRAASPQSATGC